MVRKLQRVQPTFQEKLPLLEKLAAQFADELFLFVFGSYARNQATPLSDLDLAYLPRETLDHEQALALDRALYRRLSRLLQSDDFTLVNLRQAPPTLAFTVLTEGRMLSPPRRWLTATTPHNSSASPRPSRRSGRPASAPRPGSGRGR